MNENDLYRSFQQIDDDILERSEGITKKNRKNWIILVVVAMSLGLLMMVGILAIYVDIYKDEYLDGKEKPVYVEENSTYGKICELEKRYNKTATAVSLKNDLSDKYIPLYEQCVIVEFNDKKYHTQSDVYVARIEESLLGKEIGTCKAKSDYFTYLDEILSVREICHVSSDLMIAVEIEGYHYVFRNKLYRVDTFGEMLECYGLLQVLELNRFELDQEYYTLEEDNTIWEILRTCSDAEFVWGSREKDSETICFEITSENLGIYKNEFSVSADGYVSTNMFIQEGTFYIGEEAANQIISYAKEYSKKSGYEPYIYKLTGTLLEVGEYYVLLSDSVMCKRWNLGKTFRIETDDMRFRRYFESGCIQIGDVFMICFSGELDAETGKIELGSAFEVKGADVAVDESVSFFSFMKENFLKYKSKIQFKNELKEYLQYLQWKRGSAD